MRLTILGALLASAALAGAGGIAITNASASAPLSVVRTTPVLPVTSAPGDGAYVAKTEIVERDGVSYLDVAVTYETAAKFRVRQRVCKRKFCRTVTARLTVASGTGQVAKRLGRGDHWLRGKPRIRMWALPGPTVTITAPPVTVTETVTATATATFTCQPVPPAATPTIIDTPPPATDPANPPTVDPTAAPADPPITDPTEAPEPPTADPTETPDPPTADPTEAPTDPPTVDPTGAPTDVPPPTLDPTEAPTEVPTEVPTAGPTEIPTCPQPEEPPSETPPEDPPEFPTQTPPEVPTETPPPATPQVR